MVTTAQSALSFLQPRSNRALCSVVRGSRACEKLQSYTREAVLGGKRSGEGRAEEGSPLVGYVNTNALAKAGNDA